MSEDYLLKSKTVWENCQKHIEIFHKSPPEIQRESPIEAIQNYLTQHLLVVLCAEIEEHIRGFISERAEKANDPAIKVLVDSWAAERIRSVKYDQLIGIIKIFGEDYKQYFESLLGDDREQIISAYGIAVKGRINTAHYTGIQSQTTMMDFEKGLESAEKILQAFRKTLNSPISSSPPNPPPSDEYTVPTSEASCAR